MARLVDVSEVTVRGEAGDGEVDRSFVNIGHPALEELPDESHHLRNVLGSPWIVVCPLDPEVRAP